MTCSQPAVQAYRDIFTRLAAPIAHIQLQKLKPVHVKQWLDGHSPRMAERTANPWGRCQSGMRTVRLVPPYRLRLNLKWSHAMSAP